MKRVLCSVLGVVAMLAFVGCEGGFTGDVGVGIGNPNTNVNVTTGDTNVDQNQTNTQTQTTSVSVVQSTRIGDNITIVPPPNVPPPPPPEVIEDVVVVVEEIPPIPPEEEVVVEPDPCIPVDEITADQLVAVCFTLDATVSIEEIESIYFQCDGLEGGLQITSDYLYEVEGEWCFNVELLEGLGVDPYAALDGLYTGDSIGLSYYIEFAVGISPVYETVVIQEGVPCPEEDVPPPPDDMLVPTDVG